MGKKIIVLIGIMLGFSQIGDAQILGSKYANELRIKQPAHSGNNHSMQLPEAIVYREIGFRDDNWNSTTNAWEFSDSGTFAYDNNALRVEEHDYNYSSVWKDSVKHFYTYDANGNQASYIMQVWVPWKNNFRNFTQNLTTWNLQKLNTESIYQIWDTLKNSWVTTDDAITTYDGNNRITEHTEELDTNGSLSGKVRTQYSYSKDSTIVLQQNLIAGQWVNYTLDNESVDANGFDTLDISQFWDATSATWVNNNRDAYLNTSYGYTIRDSSFTWDSKNNQWTNYIIDSISYDANRRTTSILYIFWDKAFSRWDTYDLTKYSYNSYGNAIDFEDLTGSNGKVWNRFSNDTLIYDDNQNLIQSIYELPSGSPTPGYYPYSRTIYYYNSFDLAVENAGKNELSATIFPNPTDGNILKVSFISTGEGQVSLHFCDMRGEILSSEIRNVMEGSNEIQISLPSVSAGSYFLQITNQKDAASSLLKIIKK